MATSLIADLQDGDLETYTQDGTLLVRATRTAIVRGLGTSGTAADASTALARAMLYVIQRYPKGTVYNPNFPYCTIVGHRAQGVENDGDIAKIGIRYDTNAQQAKAGQNGPGFTIEDDTEEVIEQTQLDPATKAPIYVVWENPKNKKDKIADICSISYPRTLRVISLSGIILKQDVKKYRRAVGGVNDAEFLDEPIGRWAYTGFRTVTTVGADFLSVRATMKCKARGEGNDKGDDWSTYAILRNRDNGKYVTIDPAASTRLKGLPYAYGMTGIDPPNGVIKIGPRPMVKLGEMFSIRQEDQ